MVQSASRTAISRKWEGEFCCCKTVNADQFASFSVSSFSVEKIHIKDTSLIVRHSLLQITFRPITVTLYCDRLGVRVFIYIRHCWRYWCILANTSSFRKLFCLFEQVTPYNTSHEAAHRCYEPQSGARFCSTCCSSRREITCCCCVRDRTFQ